mgnify:CR=1 FL=1
MNDPSASSFLESESPVEETIVSSESESSEAVELAKRETKTVRTLRGILIFVLVAAATGVSLAVYRFTSSQEQKSFEDAFLAHGSKVTEALSLNVEKQLHLMDTFAISLTAYAKDQNNAWPFVTVPAFERMAHSVLPQIQGLSLVYLPIVTDEERKQWEQYAQENFHRWANESIAFQESGGYDVKYHHPEDAGRDLQVADEDELDFSSGISSHIYAYNSTGGKIKAPRAQYYAPIWHNAPFLSGQDIENREMTARAYNKAGIEVAYTEMKATLVSF